MASTTYIRLLPWDSEFFGMQIAKTTTLDLPAGEVDLVLGECAAAGVRCLYCELDPNQQETVGRVQAAGFRFVEQRMMLEHNLRQAADEEPAAPGLSALLVDSCIQPVDLPYLEQIAVSIAPLSRFAVDKNFGAQASQRLYQRWLQASLQDSSIHLLVARSGGLPVGFVALKVREDTMHLDLIGVAPAARGQGVGALLLQSLVEVATVSGARKVALVTQGHNAAAVRLYERAGFRLARVTYYFHKWFESKSI